MKFYQFFFTFIVSTIFVQFLLLFDLFGQNSMNAAHTHTHHIFHEQRATADNNNKYMWALLKNAVQIKFDETQKKKFSVSNWLVLHVMNDCVD